MMLKSPCWRRAERHDTSAQARSTVRTRTTAIDVRHQVYDQQACAYIAALLFRLIDAIHGAARARGPWRPAGAISSSILLDVN
jgi:hypothetical protein